MPLQHRKCESYNTPTSEDNVDYTEIVIVIVQLNAHICGL